MPNAQEIALICLAQERGLLTPADIARLDVARQQLPEASLPELLAQEQLPASPLGALHRGLNGARFVCECGYSVDYPALVGLERFTCPRCSGRLDPIQGSASGSDRLRETASPQTARSSSLAGRMIGPYRLERELGRGTMGVVFEAVRPELSRRFALKILLDGTDEEAVRRFKREATVASRLDDPGVVGVYDVGVADGRHYYAMDFVEGRSLRDRLGQGPLRPNEAAALVRELARVMHLAHAREVTHRDLKPANVLLVPTERGEERPRIADFGLARDHRDLMSSLSRTGDVFGTPLYMSPEQILGLRVDAKADIYSLGVILYECLVDQHPFYDADWIKLAQLIRAGNYPPPSRIDATIPAALDAIVARAMALEPEDRYPTAGDLEADLAEFLERSQDDLPAPPDLASRSPLIIGVVALVLTAVLIGLLIARRGDDAASVVAAPPTPEAVVAPSAPPPNPRLLRALADADAAFKANDLGALRRALEAATAQDPRSPLILDTRRRLAEASLQRARAAQLSPTPETELGHITAATWLLDDDPQARAIAEHLLARVATMRRHLEPYARVDAFLEAASSVRGLALERREAIQLERVRVAYARAKFDDAIQRALPLQKLATEAAREAQFLSLVSLACSRPSAWPEVFPLLEQLARGSGRVATCAANIVASTRRHGPELQRQAKVALALHRAHPRSAIVAISTCYVLGPINHPQELSLIQATAQAIPDHWSLQAALGRALWRVASPDNPRRGELLSAFGRAIELTAPKGAFPRADWIKYAILLAMDRKADTLLALYKRDARRLFDAPGVDARAGYFTIMSLALFMKGDHKRAFSALEQAAAYGPEECKATIDAMPVGLRTRFQLQIGAPVLLKFLGSMGKGRRSHRKRAESPR